MLVQRIFTTVALTLTFAGMSSSAMAGAIQVSPPRVILESPESSQQLLIMQLLPDGRKTDVTRRVDFQIADNTIASINERGLVQPLKEGQTTLLIQWENQRLSVPVQVGKIQEPKPVSFRNEIVPVLTKAGCNSGGCHGKAEGQNGFKLSVFGFDAKSDHQAITMESRGRRVLLSSPQHSLFFLKGSARIPHGGGQKIEPGSYRDRRLLRWIAEGARFSTTEDETTRITKIEIEPKQQILLAGESQQIRVTAVDAAGNRHCVTTEAEYESNATPIAEVDPKGLVEASDIPGEAAILVRYLGHVAVCRITSPRLGVKITRPAENNAIDKLVWDKLQRLGIQPSPLSSDAEFLRRVFLDTIGTLPTAKEAQTFLADTSPDRRAKLIDQLLDRPEYADYWTMKLLDVMRADQLKISPQGAVAMQRWLHKHFAENRPFDELARDVLTVQGNTSAEGPGSFYKILPQPDEAARSISQLFLGVRIECAQCHHHPSERWTQADYVGLAGFFTGLKLKKLPNGEQALVSLDGKDLPHPRTGEIVNARALGAESADFSTTRDRRRVLADWMTSPNNPYFAKAIANRLWAHYLGRGLVEPVDDLRATNPATNEPLLQMLTDHMIDVKFDLKAFTRTLLNSRVYQLTSTTNASNETDRQNFSHGAYKYLPAEVLLDAISQTTGVPEKFNGWPEGYRAIQVWDNRMPSYFFTIFGRPVRASVCECERSNEPSISQALHLMYSPEMEAKIIHRHGQARRLAASDLSEQEIVTQLFLATLSRYPTSEERTFVKRAFVDNENNRQKACEDLLSALLNTKEFLFNH